MAGSRNGPLEARGFRHCRSSQSLKAVIRYYPNYYHAHGHYGDLSAALEAASQVNYTSSLELVPEVLVGDFVVIEYLGVFYRCTELARISVRGG